MSVSTAAKMSAEEFCEKYAGDHVEFLYGRVVWQSPPDEDVVQRHLDNGFEDLFFKKFEWDNWKATKIKAKKYFDKGVKVVGVLNGKRGRLVVLWPDGRELEYRDGDTLTIPDVLPGFSCRASRLY